MCGRFTETRPKAEVIKRFGISKDNFPDFNVHYNIAPGKNIPVVIKKSLKELHGFKWGLVPAWAKDASIGSHMINARAETITEKMSFKVPFKWRRCLIVADGFYEWKETSEGKVPMYIYRSDHSLFSFAGLWSHWVPRHGPELFSCTIITAEANVLMKPIHERMPVILAKEEEDLWLNPDTEEKELLSFLRPHADSGLSARKVSRKVNDPGNDYPELLE